MIDYVIDPFSSESEKATIQTEVFDKFYTPQSSWYEMTRSCLGLQNWYEYSDSNTENDHYLENAHRKYRKGQLDNCLALINSTSSQQVFDNLQPYSMQKELFTEINYIFMHAFDDFVNGHSEVNPGV